MRLLAKEFYAHTELQATWDMPNYDVQYLVLSGDLKLTIMVHGVHLISALPIWGRRYMAIPRTCSGILDLKVRDAAAHIMVRVWVRHLFIYRSLQSLTRHYGDTSAS